MEGPNTPNLLQSLNPVEGHLFSVGLSLTLPFGCLFVYLLECPISFSLSRVCSKE